MALEKYRRKRDFGITPEPRGGRVAKARGRPLSFVIQKHAASHLHYDFRLELDGVLLSWAVPKGPSLDPADKRLAMHVEDHPLEYGGFEGIIPEKQYGGGTVMLWDRGTWTPEGDPRAAYAKGHLKFDLDGEKLHGGWDLIRTGGGKYGGNGKQAWLLVKARDEFAQGEGVAPIVVAAPDSVATGRSLEDIAKARKNVWESKLSVKANVKAGAVKLAAPAKATKTTKAGALPEGAKKAALPEHLSPELTLLVDEPPAGDQWLSEIKYDGYRMVARIERGKARLFSRTGKDWTESFRGVADALAKLPVKSAWIDGEVCALDAQGRTSFQSLQNALATPGTKLTFFAFDLMFRDGYDLRSVVLTGRKKMLREVVGEGSDIVRTGPEVTGSGDEFFRQACKLGLEGTICKRVDSRYVEGARTREWVKVKCIKRQEMVIGGFTEPQGSRTGFGALLLGVYEGKSLRYAGKVGTGFDAKTLDAIYPMLQKLERDKPAFANPPRGYEAKGAHWVDPVLVGEVAFTEWSDDGALRHPSFQGLRPDKKAKDVVREEPMATRTTGKDTKAKPVERTAVAKSSGAVTVAGVALSNPDKPYFPEAGLGKRDIAEYYEFVSQWLLPHIAKRPLSLVRCPDGWSGQCFYQKHADKAVNVAVSRIEVPEGNGTATYMGAASAKALAALVQWGVIELHPWGSRQPRLDRPDQLIFDFDPDEGQDFQSVATAAQLLRTLLAEIKLQSFIKTTGGKGLHVVAPIRPTLSWEDAKGFTRCVAEFMVATFPDRFTATVSKAKRKDKIFVDYLRNGEGATAVAPYSVRARKNAPVATPIFWEELATDVRFDHFNVRNIRERLAKGRDPWADFASVKQTVTKAAAQRVGYVLSR